LDEVKYRAWPQTTVIQNDDGRIEGKSITPPNEGVFIHGLYLEGAGWNKNEKRLVESTPKELFCYFPILWVSAISTAVDKDRPGAMGGGNRALQEYLALDKNHYFCPVYKYPKRNDRYLIFNCHLLAEAATGNTKGASSAGQSNAILQWTLSGVCLLCQKD
jgi:dynein heavy chain